MSSSTLPKSNRSLSVKRLELNSAVMSAKTPPMALMTPAAFGIRMSLAPSSWTIGMTWSPGRAAP